MAQTIHPYIRIIFGDYPSNIYNININIIVNGVQRITDTITPPINNVAEYDSYLVGMTTTYFQNGDVIVIQARYNTSFDSGAHITSGTPVTYNLTIDVPVLTQPNTPSLTWETTQDSSGDLIAVGTLGDIPSGVTYILSYTYTVTRGMTTSSENIGLGGEVQTGFVIQIDRQNINQPINISGNALQAGDVINITSMYYAIVVDPNTNPQVNYHSANYTTNYTLEAPVPLTADPFTATIQQGNYAVGS